MNSKVKIFFIALFLSLIFPLSSYASVTSGTIDNVNKYAWSENAGWVNFGTTNGGVTITDSTLTGSIWTENYGWINLSPTNSGVKNNSQGILSGQAWGENIGWVDFSAVIINSGGRFTGSATNDIIGSINFDCTNCNVATDYRPSSQRPQCNNGVDDDGDGRVDYPSDFGCSSLNDNNESDNPSNGPVVVFSSGGGNVIFPSTSTDVIHTSPDVFALPPTLPINNITETETEEVKDESGFFTKILSGVGSIPKIVSLFVTDFLRLKDQNTSLVQVPIEKLVPKNAPLALLGKWNLFPKSVDNFVLSPLPNDIRRLALKFPELAETLKKVGVTKVTDISKLNSVRLSLPGLSETVGLSRADTLNIPGLSKKLGLSNPNFESKTFSLPRGIPLAKLSSEIKQKLPTEIVFAKSGGDLVDYNIALTVGNKGQTEQKIQTIVGKQLKLVVKPDNKVKSIKGYVVYKSKITEKVASSPVLNKMTASALFSDPEFSKPQEKPVRVEEKMVLLEFEYTDPDGDGIYTAEIETPVVEGEYEIITVMDYEDPNLAMRQMRMIAVVDPEGYIFEKMGNKEIRIPGAIVSLLWLNPETKEYELWPAKDFQQENSQVTDVRGTYSFLVPVGMYSIKVDAPGYTSYEGKPFEVREGSGVHTNIELKSKYWWLDVIDWKTILLIVVIVLLVYNFYKDKVRDKLLNKKYE